MSRLDLSSPAFEDGNPIPRRYGYTAENVNPPLTIRNVPEEAASLALVMDDPDAVEPAGKIWDHWVVWNLNPELTDIPADWDATDAVEGQNDFGEHGYGGPNPPDREHTYRFTCYALAETIDVAPGGTKSDVEEATENLLIAETTLTGTYAP